MTVDEEKNKVQDKLHLLSSVIDPLEDLTKAALANALLLREHNLRIHFLHKVILVYVYGFQRLFISHHALREDVIKVKSSAPPVVKQFHELCFYKSVSYP